MVDSLILGSLWKLILCFIVGGGVGYAVGYARDQEVRDGVLLGLIAGVLLTVFGLLVMLIFR